MGKKHIPLAVVAATAIALSSGQSAFATEDLNTVSQPGSNATGTEGAVNTTLEKKTISKVEKISKTEIVVIYNEEVNEDTVKSTTELVVKNPSGTQVKLTACNIDETNKKKVTYTFTKDFAYGKWTVDGEHFYTVEGEKIADYVGLEVVRITTEGVVLKLPKDSISSEELSVRDPKGNEIAVQKPSSADSEGNVTYKFGPEITSIEAGTWTINTDTKFKVLTKEENEAKVEAVQKKIKTAKLTLSTSKNYVKNILAAQAAYDALTMEQKSLLPDKSSDKNIMSKEDLETLYNDILGVNGVYTPVKTFEDKIKSLVSNSNTFVADVEASEKAYTALTKEQLSYVDAKIKKQYTAYLNEAAVQKALTFDMSNLEGKANDIIDFNKAYKKLSKTEKEDILLDSAKKQKVTELTDKTLQKNASAALTVQKKFEKLEVQKKNDKNKKLYYTEENQQDGTTKKVETTTKTSEPVMVYSLSAVTKAQTALAALQKKNKAAYDLVDPKLLNKAKEDSTIQASIAKGELFNKAVKAPSDIKDFVSEFAEAKKAYIALTADEQKYAIDKNALKQYKAYLKIDKVAVMYDKMDDPEASTKSMKLAYTATGDITSITNDVKFSKGKFTIPKGNYKFEFKDGSDSKSAYYKDGVWTVGTVPTLTATPVTAQEIYAYAKAFNALKDADEAILTKGANGEVYKQYVGKENDYKKAAAVEKKIASAVKSKRKATIASAQKALVALTETQQGYVSNRAELVELQKK